MPSKDSDMTIFSMPNAFEGHIAVIQCNAITSWTMLRPRPQIILFGNDRGTREIVDELGLLHVQEVLRNEKGTPLADDMFRQAHQIASHDVLLYINTDIILFNDLNAAINKITVARLESFLIIGKRIDIDIREPLNFLAAEWENELLHITSKVGKVAPGIAKDYFVFPKSLYSEIPPFVIGRGNWDNWIVYQAHKMGVPVIDGTQAITAIHQNHDYEHLSGDMISAYDLSGGRASAYVIGPEAKKNQELAGGMHAIKGSFANWN